MKVYIKKPFDFPRRKKRIAWYVEILCSKLLRQDQITQEDMERFWNEIKMKQKELPFPWQKDNLKCEAEEGLNKLLGFYQYDSEERIYKKGQK